MSKTRASRLLGWLFILVSVSGAGSAQETNISIRTEPFFANALQPVTLVLTTPCGCPAHDNNATGTGFARAGFVVDIAHATGCFAACISDEVERYNLGLLPAGVYTVRHYPFGRPAATTVLGTFIVHAQPAEIPALSPAAMTMLALALSAIAAVALRR